MDRSPLSIGGGVLFDLTLTHSHTHTLTRKHARTHAHAQTQGPQFDAQARPSAREGEACVRGLGLGAWGEGRRELGGPAIDIHPAVRGTYSRPMLWGRGSIGSVDGGSGLSPDSKTLRGFFEILIGPGKKAGVKSPVEKK